LILSEFDHYLVLGVSPAASQEEIKKSWRTFVLKYHPDANLDRVKLAEELFIRGKRAYDTLSDPTRRARHDEELSKRGAQFIAVWTASRRPLPRVEVVRPPDPNKVLAELLWNFFAALKALSRRR
jgi:curved DNA-binding protein CbpA